MGGKYELTSDSIEFKGRKLYRIKALRKMGYILEGELGGYIESYSNLSQSGFCWVDPSSKVYGNGSVTGDDKVWDYTVISGNKLIDRYFEVRKVLSRKIGSIRHYIIRLSEKLMDKEEDIAYRYYPILMLISLCIAGVSFCILSYRLFHYIDTLNLINK